MIGNSLPTPANDVSSTQHQITSSTYDVVIPCPILSRPLSAGVATACAKATSLCSMVSEHRCSATVLVRMRKITNWNKISVTPHWKLKNWRSRLLSIWIHTGYRSQLSTIGWVMRITSVRVLGVQFLSIPSARWKIDRRSCGLCVYLLQAVGLNLRIFGWHVLAFLKFFCKRSSDNGSTKF